VNRRRVLVTGARGFVGGHLVDRLVRDETDVVAMHQRAIPPDVRERTGPQVRWVQSDLTNSDLAEIANGVDSVFHFAAYSTVTETEADRLRLDRANVAGTKRLASASKSVGVRRFIFANSIAAGEAGDGPTIDETNAHAISCYGKAKLAAEKVLMAISDDAFPVTSLRASALFGEQHQGSFCEMTKAILRGRFAIVGDGGNRTSFHCVCDFADALFGAELTDAAQSQVLTAADNPCASSELASMISAVSGSRRPSPRLAVSIGMAAGAAFDPFANLTGRPMPLSIRRVKAMARDVGFSGKKLERMTGIRPDYRLGVGIAQTVSWYRQTGLLA
jgi:nucleoside-diphosphate-sugar epimerase